VVEVVSRGHSDDAASPTASTERRGPGASDLLRVRQLWLVPTIVLVAAIVVVTLAYFGSMVDPVARLDGLPVAVVVGDGAPAEHVADALRADPEVRRALTLDPMTRSEAIRRMDDGAYYAAVVVPADVAASGEVEVLTNTRAGSIGVDLATQVLRAAVPSTAEPAAGRTAQVRVVEHRPPPATSALGMSAFYLSLLTTMCGFLAATVVQSSLDAGLGLGASEMGPRWTMRPTIVVDRFQTLLTKWAMASALIPVLTGLVVIVASLVLGLDAPHPVQLWLFMSLAAIVVGVGTLTLLAALGSIGQLAAMVLFIYLALSSSGGTVPVQALPPFFRWFAVADPLRQILGGVRSILYFDARMDAGLGRALLQTTVGLLLWIAIGAVATRWYDRRGWLRGRPAGVQPAAEDRPPTEP
jgi:hypothetical protein